jgi:hypothetical protein
MRVGECSVLGCRLVVGFVFGCILVPEATFGVPLSTEAREFFESKIRPVLVESCYECHNSAGTARGRLALDHRDGLRRGGRSGEVIDDANPRQSLLLSAIRHEIDDLRMPKAGPKLAPEVVADFERWLAMGAPDPRDAPPAPEVLAASISWEATFKRRKEWWSFRALGDYSPPAGKQERSSHPVDRFIRAKLAEQDLEPSGPASRRVVARRLGFALTGLPLTPTEIEEFVTDASPTAYEDLVDRLLESPRLGERWARHWMDWFRYAESHGSQGDSRIPYAWRYRDYLIRALNADVSYDQLVREHVAGDLLPAPRIDPATQLNESAIGIGHLRMVQHTYAPVDAHAEQVRTTDQQIDVLSKALLGLTVSCARCHDHKFDAISQKDFYALYGVFASCVAGVITVDTPQKLALHRETLTASKPRIRGVLAAAWREALDGFSSALESAPTPTPKEQANKRAPQKPKDGEVEKLEPLWQQAVDEANAAPGSPLHAWVTLRALEGDAFTSGWKEQRVVWETALARRAVRETTPYPRRWDLTKESDYSEWYRSGGGLPARPSTAGEFHVLGDGGQIISNIYPAGVYTHGVSKTHNGVLLSRRVPVDTDTISVRFLGQDARARLLVRGYPLILGPIYDQRTRRTTDTMRWYHWDAKYWHGEIGRIEVVTGGEIPSGTRTGPSWFGIAEVVFVGEGQERPEEVGAPVAAFTETTPDSSRRLADAYVDSLRAAINAWEAETITDDQAEFLGFFVRHRLLPNTLATLPKVASLVAEYRRLAAEIPVPTRAPGVHEADAFDQPLLVSGNHQKPGDLVPRRFLTAFDGAPYRTQRSGRLELADDLVSEKSPLTARVVVNRVWHHLFGRGIVPSTDNFGRLGEPPTHPELLDYLARRFIRDDWSLKRLIRLLVTSETYRATIRPSPAAAERDAANALLSHRSIRRLEAEAIRDAILQTAGKLDLTMFGPGAGHGTDRRSVYLEVRRNRLHSFLRVFDFPVPITTRGRRDVTNVPAHSLTLLNDPFVIAQAGNWASAVLANPTLSDPRDRVARMFTEALGRPPTAAELDASLDYVRGGDPERAWQDFAQSLFNLKEFIYVR